MCDLYILQVQKIKMCSMNPFELIVKEFVVHVDLLAIICLCEIFPEQSCEWVLWLLLFFSKVTIILLKEKRRRGRREREKEQGQGREEKEMEQEHEREREMEKNEM